MARPSRGAADRIERRRPLDRPTVRVAGQGSTGRPEGTVGLPERAPGADRPDALSLVWRQVPADERAGAPGQHDERPDVDPGDVTVLIAADTRNPAATDGTDAAAQRVSRPFGPDSPRIGHDAEQDDHRTGRCERAGWRCPAVGSVRTDRTVRRPWFAVKSIPLRVGPALHGMNTPAIISSAAEQGQDHPPQRSPVRSIPGRSCRSPRSPWPSEATTVNGRVTCSPPSGRGAEISTRTAPLCPGARSRTGGLKANRTTRSGSCPPNCTRRGREPPRLSAIHGGRRAAPVADPDHARVEPQRHRFVGRRRRRRSG